MNLTDDHRGSKRIGIRQHDGAVRKHHVSDSDKLADTGADRIPIRAVFRVRAAFRVIDTLSRNRKGRGAAEQKKSGNGLNVMLHRERRFRNKERLKRPGGE